MDRSYRNRLLRDALRDPERLPVQRRFWKREFWECYLQRCDDVLYEDPRAGLRLTRPAPHLAARIAETDPDAEPCDLLLHGHAYLASAYRRADDYAAAERSFARAAKYEDCATPEAVAEYLRRLSYFKTCLLDPVALELADAAVEIRRRGNLVDRHQLGRCLICRAYARAAFGEYGAAVDDWTAALNHVSFTVDKKEFHAAVHNLVCAVVEYGDRDDLRRAYENLKPVFQILHRCHGSRLAQLKLRWVLAILDTRLGHYGHAEETFRALRDEFADLGLTYELGMLSTDLARLYLEQGRRSQLEALVRQTAEIFRCVGVDAHAQKALDLWRHARTIDAAFLQRLRDLFGRRAKPGPTTTA